jgi:hypothetical protein
VVWVLAEEAKKEGQAVSSLRSLAPQTCGQATGHLTKIRTSIQHLKQQINTAQHLLKAMQVQK